MIACTITVGGITYAGLFSSTTAAVIDAMTRYPAARRPQHQREGPAMNASQIDKRAAQGDTNAAWLVGWWQGKVVGFVLGLGTAVLLGWVQ